MSVLTKFFPKTLAKINSPINGEISVIEQFGQRKIVIGGLTQSGPMAEEVWERGIKKLIKKNIHRDLNESNILILGLGGGSLVKLLTKYFPGAKITGVEIDPIMIDLGKKYLELLKFKNLKIKIIDANEFSKKTKDKFDLIFVDSYIGDKVPETLQTEMFLNNLKKILKNKGMIVFNRLYYKNHIFEAKIFLDKLKKIFNDLDGENIFTNLLIYAVKNE